MKEQKLYNPYFYSVKVNVRCENCDNEYKRIDNFWEKERLTKKYFENFYDDNEIEEIEKCQECDSYMFPDEIINITEHKVTKYLEYLNLYINDKNRIIPTNSMKLVGITLEGTNETNKCEAIIMDLSEENYKKIWNHGKDLWNNGYISKYLICFLENDNCFIYSRPDQENFEVCRKMDNYMKYDKEIEIFNSNNKYFLIKDNIQDILKFYKVEEILNDIPPTKERGCDFEIN